MTNTYLEFRVYLKEGTPQGVAEQIADELHSAISDLACNDGAPQELTQDVTWELKSSVKAAQKRPHN